MPSSSGWSRKRPNLYREQHTPNYSSFQATPLMIGGVLYFNTPLSQGVAVDARTGKTLWVFNPKSYEEGTTSMTVTWRQRGVAYWSDGDRERILWGTGSGDLICVNAKTGHPCADFGLNGRIDLTQRLPRAGRSKRDYLNAMLYSVQSPPIVVGDVVIHGSSIADRRINKEAVPGWVRAWDVRTGEHMWDFHTVPQAGEEGVETWENDSWTYSGNANVWPYLSADEELGYVYLPTGTATNDYYGGHRPGDNLFAESIVCVDAKTGKKVWHFQAVHHGLWDYDFPTAPNLLDITVDGKQIKALAQVSKQGFLYAFNRVTGEPIWPIEERPVATDTNFPRRGAFADPAVPDTARPLRVPGRGGRRPGGLHPSNTADGPRGGQGLPARSALHAADACGWHDEGSFVQAAGQRRGQLVGRRGRPGDRHALRAVAKQCGRDGVLST